MKYIIDIPDNTHWIQWIMEGTKDHHPYMDWIDVKDLRFYTEHDRNAIENEVWEFAGKIFEMDMSTYAEIYDDKGFNSYREAKSKYDAWLKQKDEIRIGDELKDDENIRAVVLDIMHEDYVRYEVFTENGIVDEWQKGIVAKTGRHFSEVAELLEKMRGEEE